MKNNLFLFVFLPFFLFSTSLFSQISEKGQPSSFLIKKNSKVNYVHLEAPDVSKIKNTKGKAFQFAKKIDVNIPIKEKKFIYEENALETIWQIGITSKEALSLNLSFSDFRIPIKARLFIYSADKKVVLGAFTSKNNKKSGILPIFPINSDSIVIEYSEPRHAKFHSELKIMSVGYGFIDISSNNELKSGSCNIDVRCDLGLPWYAEKRGVAKILINNSSYCTGSLINNTNNDETPYFLTANHCIEDESSANNTIFNFNYEYTNCNGLEIDDFHTLSGATLIATPASNNQLDFALLKLSSVVPDRFIPYYAGWDISTTPATSAVSIHHPDGDVKKISETKKTLTSTTYPGYISNTHWNVSSWDLGTTEGGSSGGPLFNEKHLIIGDLTGGSASCSNINGSDQFAKISSSWDYFPENNRQLKHWLNPNNLNITELEAFDPFPLSSEIDAGIVEIISPKGNFCSGDAIRPSFLLRNFSFNNLSSVDVSYLINNNLIETIHWTGNLASYESEVIQFAEISKVLGNYTFSILLENPNSGIDANALNDTLSNNFNLIEGNKHRLTLKTDNYASETTWQVMDDQKNILYSGGPYENNTSYTYDFCFEMNQCYTFKIFDAGDGICCNYGNGSYKLQNSIGDIIFQGGTFTTSMSHSFCAYPSNINPISNDEIKLHPNPVSDFITIETDSFINMKYTIYTFIGEKLKEGKIDSNENSIPFEGFNSGIYIIKIYNDDQLKLLSKIIKL